MPDLEIREFQHGDEAAFRSLNLEWIERYFQVEAADLAQLDDPRAGILDRGGRIFFAVRDGRPIGCCALLRVSEEQFEVAKMAVSADSQGGGVGRAVLQAVIEAARKTGARRLWLETNHVLTPAIRLYESLGFQHVEAHHHSPYARSDVQMELVL